MNLSRRSTTAWSTAPTAHFVQAVRRLLESPALLFVNRPWIRNCL